MITAIVLILLALRCAIHAIRPDFVAHSQVRWMSIILGILGGFLGVVLLFSGGVALAAEATATTADFRPLWGYGVELAVAVLGALGAWAINRLSAWLGLRQGDSMRAYVDSAFARALQYAAEQALARGKDLAAVDVRSEMVAIAAKYAVETVPDALRHFGIDGPGLEKRLLARLPEVIPHPAQPVAFGTPLDAPLCGHFWPSSAYGWPGWLPGRLPPVKPAAWNSRRPQTAKRSPALRRSAVRRLILLPALILAATLCLSGCVTAAFEPPKPVIAITACPAWPVAGPVVADELATLPIERYPATWEWIGRLSTLRDQLGVCHRG